MKYEGLIQFIVTMQIKNQEQKQKSHLLFKTIVIILLLLLFSLILIPAFGDIYGEISYLSNELENLKKKKSPKSQPQPTPQPQIQQPQIITEITIVYR